MTSASCRPQGNLVTECVIRPQESTSLKMLSVHEAMYDMPKNKGSREVVTLSAAPTGRFALRPEWGNLAGKRK